jgi:hypothetical protein
VFDLTDRRLESWARDALGDREISFAAPEAEAAKPRISLYLLDLYPNPAGRGLRLPPLQITLRYLVSVYEPDPAAAHETLGKLLIAALESNDLVVAPEPVPFELWRGFGTIPQPAFILCVPFKYEREEKLAPLVRKRLDVRQTILESLTGEIFINEIAIANASVRLPKFNLSTSTNVDGRFVFPSVPIDQEEMKFVIGAKGRVYEISASEAEKADETFLFRLKLEE